MYSVNQVYSYAISNYGLSGYKNSSLPNLQTANSNNQKDVFYLLLSTLGHRCLMVSRLRLQLMLATYR